MGAPSVVAAILRPGWGWCRARRPRGASRSCSGSPSAAANTCASSLFRVRERPCRRCPERRRRSAAGCAACSVVHTVTRGAGEQAGSDRLGATVRPDRVRPERLWLKMALDAGPFMRLGTRGSPSWPGLDPETGYVDADCSDQVAKTACRRGGPYVEPPYRSGALDVDDRRRWAGQSNRRMD
jgi:hypothetical protein